MKARKVLEGLPIRLAYATQAMVDAEQRAKDLEFQNLTLTQRITELESQARINSSTGISNIV